MNCKAKSNAFEANLGKPRSCSAKYSTCPNPKAKRRKSSRPCKTSSNQSSRIIKTMIWTIWLKIWIITVTTYSKRPSMIISRGRRRSQTCAKLCIMLEAKSEQRARAERSHQFRQKKTSVRVLSGEVRIKTIGRRTTILVQIIKMTWTPKQNGG